MRRPAGTNQNQDHVSFPLSFGGDVVKMDGLKEMINQGAFGVLVNGGCLASKREGNEWSHSVRGPPASAAA